jgi:hypothetical protein
MREKFHAWMPVTKSSDGGFIGILSDNSIDRDEEFMTKELLESWAANTNPLPMLANHENKMEKFIGGWSNKRLVENGKKTALTAEPFFFSKEANPLASQIQKQVEEALDKGMGVGISIGAIPKSSIEKEIDGETHVGFTKAEIVEATVVPIQSNRNATFSHIAKDFDIDLTKNKTLENTEVNKMTEELNKESTEETPVEEAPVEEPKEEAPVEGEKPEGTSEVDEAMKALNTRVIELEKQLKDLKEKAVMNNAPKLEVVKEVPEQKNEEEMEYTINNMLKLSRAGGK